MCLVVSERYLLQLANEWINQMKIPCSRGAHILEWEGVTRVNH